MSLFEIVCGGEAWDYLGLCGSYQSIRGSGGGSVIVESEAVKPVVSLIEAVSILQELSQGVAKGIPVQEGIRVVVMRAKGVLKPDISG